MLLCFPSFKCFWRFALLLFLYVILGASERQFTNMKKKQNKCSMSSPCPNHNYLWKHPGKWGWGKRTHIISNYSLLQSFAVEELIPLKEFIKKTEVIVNNMTNNRDIPVKEMVPYKH